MTMYVLVLISGLGMITDPSFPIEFEWKQLQKEPEVFPIQFQWQQLQKKPEVFPIQFQWQPLQKWQMELREFQYHLGLPLQKWNVELREYQYQRGFPQPEKLELIRLEQVHESVTLEMVQVLPLKCPIP